MPDNMPPRESFFNLQNIRWRYILLNTLVIIIGLILTVTWVTKQIRVEANNVAVEKAKGDLKLAQTLLDSRSPGPWSIRDGSLYKGETLINGNNDFVDEVGYLTGDTCTIFQGDTRVSTNVIRENTRVLGTRVSEEVGKVVLEEGKNYYGEADVVGVLYQAAYSPILDQDGKVIGIWYVGANKQFVDNAINFATYRVVLVFSAILICVLVIILYFTNSLTRPINELAVAAKRLAQGDLETEVQVSAHKEVGYLARTFEQMRRELKQQYSELQKSNDLLRESHQKLLDIIEFLPDATFVIDSDRKVIAWNKAIEEMTGVPKEDIIGKGDYSYAEPFYNKKRPILIDLIFSDDREMNDIYPSVEKKGNTLYAEIYIPNVFNGMGANLWGLASPLYDENDKIVGAIESLRDISEHKRMEKQLQYLATHDALTNIPNRYSLTQTLKRAVAKAKRGEKSAFLFIDLDNFKLVNDTLGHATGDELLVTMAKILRRNLREGDLLARFGGDEFCVLLEGATFEEAEIVAEKLRQAVDQEELVMDKHKCCLNLSVSIGVVMVDGTLDTQKVLSYADNALYMAKDNGKNRVTFLKPDEETELWLSETNRMITLINSALKDDLFTLFFQPVIRVSDGRIMHHEMLLRLQAPDGELILPNRFIPIAERFGLMPQVDRWVVQSSLAALKKYPELKPFINLSGLSLGDEELLLFIEKHISESGIEPSRIGFEITETTAVKDMARAERWIHRLKRLGCRFALDDFGIGFSSFSYLRLLPVDYLKIDGSYIRDMDRDATHKSLVKAINAVAHALGKKTIAEFVENEEIMKSLGDMDIDFGQGYYLGKPISAPAGLEQI
ncbi:EAL domain-containing protein [Pelotomaculum propionicicum]|uniref:EAL domain-containing protein n=1 Tax=Pelotomaculum propionicicum TaxID=258475 RepID=UPI003B764866